MCYLPNYVSSIIFATQSYLDNRNINLKIPRILSRVNLQTVILNYLPTIYQSFFDINTLDHFSLDVCLPIPDKAILNWGVA